MSCTPEPVVQSCDTGQQMPYWQLSIDHNIDFYYLFYALDLRLLSKTFHIH